MIEIDQLIEYWKAKQRNRTAGAMSSPDPWVQWTITYLVAFKQVHEMLKNLGNAIQGVNPEGD